VLAQSDLRTQILGIPGVGMGSPTDADWQGVGALCLDATKANVFQGEFDGVELTFMGLKRVPAHRPAARFARDGGGVHPVAGDMLERVFLRRPAHQPGYQDPAGHGGEPDRFPGHQLVVDGGPVDGRDCALGGRGHFPRALHHQTA
jgi:hypothetical protein